MSQVRWTSSQLIEFVNSIAEAHDKGYLPFMLHLPGGNEEQLIEIFAQIREGDYVLSTHRNMYHALLHGVSPESLKKQIFNGRSMNITDRGKNFYVSAIIGNC